MKTSIKDIAQELNLSKATISWILSGKGEEKGFNAATIKRVKDYAEQINYQPNLLARSLSLGVSHTIGLIIPFIGDTFYASLTQAIEREADKHGYALIVCSSEGDGNKEFELTKILKAKQVDGIIIAPTKQHHKSVDYLVADSIPFVFVDRYYPDINTNYVIVNNSEACRETVSHLLKQGARKITLLATDTHLHVMQQRITGYRTALEKAGLHTNPSLEIIIDRNTYKKDIIQKLDGLFALCPDVDGFFFSTHYLAMEALRYFISRKIDYHGRFRMGCFHETGGLDIMAPEMCVTLMQLDRIGSETVKILLENIAAGKDYEYKHVIVENIFQPSIQKNED